MKLEHPIRNRRTFTLKDRRPLQPLISYQDARNVLRDNTAFMESLTNLSPADAEEVFNWESLKVSNEIGVNLETLQSKRNAIGPTAKCNSSQRMDMGQSQLNVAVMPTLNAEFPIIDSCMRHDLYARSSCIKKATGKITVLAKIKYQFRTIYVYDLNGKIDYLDTCGVVETNGFGCIEATDLKDLPIGETVDISQDSFLIKYPTQYDPATDTVAMGYNPRTIVSTEWYNSGDSAAVSMNLISRFTTLKCKTINIHLNGKSIKSKFGGKFPGVGKFINRTILFKVCNDIGLVSELAQSADMATGVEDDSIIVDDNSILTSVEVYCNQPIKDPDLEQLRLELLEFRHKVYDAIAPLVENEYDRCSHRLRVLKDNYSHDLFNVGAQELKYPYIKMKVVTIDRPILGQKFSNNYGAKFTVEHVYPDGWVTDELGRSIDLIYPATAIVNRTVGGLLWEVDITAISDLLKYKVEHDEVTPERTFEFVEKLMAVINVQDEFNYSKFTPETLYEYLKIDHLRFILMPYSNNLTLETYAKMLELAEEYIGYRKFDIFVGLNEKIKMTSPHSVGRLYTFRDMHDTQYGNSSCSTVEKNTKGFAANKDNSKRSGRSKYNKKSVKYDVQNQHILLNICTNADADIMLNGDDGESLHGIVESMEAAGLSIGFRYNADEDDIDE